MKTNPVSCAIALSICLITGTVVAGEQTDTEPWETLFNGKDFEGWSIVGGDGKAWVQDSTIQCQKVTNTAKHTLVRTNEKYDNFILECDCKIEGDFNTCIMFRCTETPDTNNDVLYGYQVKIDPTPRKWTGGIFSHYDSALHWLYSLENDERAREAFRMNAWNHFRIEAIGKNMKVWINGIPTCNLDHSKYSKGYIALKVHSLGSDSEKTKARGYFRNIRIISKFPERYKKEMDIPARKGD